MNLNVRSKTQSLVLMGMFIAIMLILATTPLGMINLGFMRATILHIPVIIGSIVLGPKYGAALGVVFGIISVVTATIAPVPMSIVFSPFIPQPGTDRGSMLTLIVAFVPRILVGIFPFYVYKLFTDTFSVEAGTGTARSLSRTIGLSIAAVVGSMTNTILVLNLAYLFFAQAWDYRSAADITYAFIMGLIATAGIPEAIAAAVIVPMVCVAVFAVNQRTPIASPNHNQ